MLIHAYYKKTLCRIGQLLVLGYRDAVLKGQGQISQLLLVKEDLKALMTVKV